MRVATAVLLGSLSVGACADTDLGPETPKPTPIRTVVLETNFDQRFVSLHNGSTPAIDTVPVGATVAWALSPFDYDDHNVTSVGLPALPGGGGFPYAVQSQVRITFTQPGVYRYRDTFSEGTGTVVVQ
jgi:plastocyanin